MDGIFQLTKDVCWVYVGSEEEDGVMSGIHADTGERDAGRLGAEWESLTKMAIRDE
jgi:hypothetical protein